MPRGISWTQIARDLKHEVSEDNVSNGAAAMAYFFMLSIFPMMIALLSLIPYLPIPNLESAIMDFLKQVMPGDAANLFTETVTAIVSERQSGLLTIGLLLTLWSGSTGFYATMQQLNITYDVEEGRGFVKARATAVFLMLICGALMISAFALIVFGGFAQDWLASYLGWSEPLKLAFQALRWVIILAFMLLAFALTYYLGPDVEQKFKFITPGSVFGVVTLLVASIAFKVYVANFGNYSAAYGSLGAVIVLMIYLYMLGWVILLGSEVNAVFEHYSPRGKVKGEKTPHGAGHRGRRLHPV